MKKYRRSQDSWKYSKICPFSIQIIAPKPQRKSFLRGTNVPFYLYNLFTRKPWVFHRWWVWLPWNVLIFFVFCLAMFRLRRTSRPETLAATNNFRKHQSWHTLTHSCPPWKQNNKKHLLMDLFHVYQVFFESLKVRSFVIPGFWNREIL